MERTIGYHWHSSLCGAGLCDICGARFPMDELHRNADGFMTCRPCSPGRTRTELDEERVAAAQEIDQRELDEEQARFDAGDT
jgi:hypothetical protein